MIADSINGCFEFCGFLTQLANIKALYRDKVVRGFNLMTALFFAAWGYWNCYYYPHLHQWLSFSAGMLLAAGNSVWFSMAIYYRGRGDDGAA